MADKLEIEYLPSKDGISNALSETGSTVIARARNDAAALVARELRAAVKLDGQWGIINQTGYFVLEPTYHDIRPFHCGRAAYSDSPLNFIDMHYSYEEYGRRDQGDIFRTPVDDSYRACFYDNYEGGNWGFLNSTGSPVIRAKFKELRNFSEDLAGVSLPSGEGYIGLDGRMAIEADFQAVSDFKEGIAIVRSGGKCGFIDKSGRFIIEPYLDYVWEFSDGLACVEIERKYGFITRSGHFAIQPNFDTAFDFKGGVARVTVKGRQMHIDKAGSIISETPDEIQEAIDLGEGRAKIEIEENLWRTIDVRGELVGDVAFDCIKTYQEERAPVLDRENWGYIDKYGMLAIEARFSSARGFSSGMAAVAQGGKWGFIDRAGKNVIPFQFDDARDFQSIGG